MTLQNVDGGKITLTVNRQRGVDIGLRSVDLTLNIKDLSERVIAPAMRQLANTVDRDLLELYAQIPQWVGQLGRKIHSVSDLAAGKEGSPIIFDAIERGDLTQVQRLVAAGADIDKQGFGDQTPALRSASTRQWDICLYLLKQGADPTVADDVGLTIPYIAFKANNLPTSYQGQYLAKFKEYLIKRNLDALNIPPKRVRELQASGACPPRGVTAVR